MFRGRSLRSRKLRGRPDSGEENVTLDYSKAPAENVKEILNNVVDQGGTSKTRKLAYYNAFVRLCYRSGDEMDYGMSVEEVLCCLRLGLYHEAKEMRAACMRAIRYMCRDHETVDAILRLHIDYLLVRSLDYCLDNEIERIHALRLMRKMMLVHPEHFPKSLLSVLISIANDGSKERDKMLRTCLATLCELSLLNPKLVVKSGAFSAILRSILDSYHLPRINESLLATVLNLLNTPTTRQHIQSDIELQQLLAPFTDCHYRFSGEGVDQSLREERENRYAASKMAIATVIRSWPGIIRLCKPDGAGLQSLLGVLYLPNMETRKEIMDILYDIFRLAVPEWTDDFSQALISVDPSEMRDSWKLNEGFVAEEGKSILPHITKTRTDLVDNHLALILSSFISAGLLEAIVETIATSDIEVAIRATILLGELLHMANSILPHECNQTSHCLPTLMSLAASFTVPAQQRNLANMAITCLSRLHAMKKRGPVPCSLYLDQILQTSGLRNKEDMYRPLKLHKESLMSCLPKPMTLAPQFERHEKRSFLCIPTSACIPLNCAPHRPEAEHDMINQAVFDSQVLRTKENFSWNWDLIAAILKWPDENLKRIDDQNNQRFMRRLVYFFKPSSKLFSAVELSHENCKKFVIAGCHLVDFLVECEKGDGQKFWEEWLSDIKQCLNEVTAQRAPSDALFSPTNLSHTAGQDYFLLIGRFSASNRGDKILEKMGIYQCLLDLMTITTHDTYIKLIVSSLDYSRDGLARVILSKGLTATSENARLYTASFMRVLLRARVPFLASWGMELLVMQLYDQSRAVAMEALSVISEACEEEVNLVNLVKLRPSVLHLGYKGSMLLARFLSVPTGFKSLMDSGYISHELDKWHQGFNAKYVSIVEERLNEAFTTYEKTYDGSYTRRSSRRQPRKDVYLPVHFYGQLVQHRAGFELLEKQEYLPEYFHCIRCQELKKEEHILKLKTALWAVGHMGTSVWGLGLLQEEGIIPEIIKVAEESGVFTIRGTAFFVLGLIASTSKGADILTEFGWESVRHKHSDLWPVILENYASDYTELTSNLSSVSLASSAKSDVLTAGSSLMMSQWSERKETGYHSPSDQSPSPKASFWIEDDQVKSRSNTESSLPPTIASPSDSPQKDSGVNLEPVIDTSVDVEVHYSESRGRSLSATSQTNPVERESPVPHNRSESDPLRKSGQSVIQEVPAIQLQADSHSARHLTNTSQRTSQTVTGRKPPWLNPEYKSKSLEKDLLKQRSSSYRDERSSSNTSSWTTKSRSDSVNTDSTTSGVSSVESAPHVTVDFSQVGSLLSPIPSASSVATDGRSQQGSDSGSLGVHPSDTLRKLMNFKRVPSLKRRYSNPVLGHLSHLKIDANKGGSMGDGSVWISTQQDVQGYATLRELQLQRQRTFSVETEPGMDASPELEEPFLQKTKSMDYRLGAPRNGFRQRPGNATLPSKFPFANMSFRKQIARVMACTRNQSFISLQELDRPASSANLQAYDSFPRNMSKQSLRRMEKVPSTGRSEYIGLCLPVDVNMIFQVNEGEDKRSCPDDTNMRKDAQERPVKMAAARSVSQSDDDGLEYHNPSTCLGCYRVRSAVSVSTEHLDDDVTDDEAFTTGSKLPSIGSTPFASAQPTPSVSAGPSPNPSIVEPSVRKGQRSRNSSMSEMIANLPGSVVSNVSFLDSATRHLMSEDSEEGRRLIRKECLRLIINLSSSVGVKAAEQGLLILRQKFQSSFQDICLYSEVCYLLAHYNFRLGARRFIQELFQDMTFTEHFKEPYKILGIPVEDSSDRPEIPKELHEKLDRVEESLKMDDSVT